MYKQTQDHIQLDRTISDLILSHVIDAINGKPLPDGEDRLPRLPSFWLNIPPKVRGRLVDRYIPEHFRALPSCIQIAAENALNKMATCYAERCGLVEQIERVTA